MVSDAVLHLPSSIMEKQTHVGESNGVMNMRNIKAVFIGTVLHGCYPETQLLTSMYSDFKRALYTSLQTHMRESRYNYYNHNR